MRNKRIIRNYIILFLLGTFSPIKGYWAVVFTLPAILLLAWDIDDTKVKKAQKKLC